MGLVNQLVSCSSALVFRRVRHNQGVDDPVVVFISCAALSSVHPCIPCSQCALSHTVPQTNRRCLLQRIRPLSRSVPRFLSEAIHQKPSCLQKLRVHRQRRSGRKEPHVLARFYGGDSQLEFQPVRREEPRRKFYRLDCFVEQTRNWSEAQRLSSMSVLTPLCFSISTKRVVSSSAS